MTGRIIFLLLVIFLSCSKTDKYEEEEIISINDVLPSLDLILSDGSLINDEKLAGKVSLILLFSVQCPDCKQQIPILEKVYNEMKGNDKVIMFGISRAQGQSMVEEFWQKEDITFPYSAQEDDKVYRQFANSIVPRIYISDKNRVVKFISTDNPLASFDELINTINSLI